MKPSPELMAFRTEALALLKKHAGELPAEEMLAMSAHMVGQILAMQDQRQFTTDELMRMVCANIECGNHEVIDSLATTTGGTA